ncbi:hypothetical protein [Myroides odoratus]|uniref:hypothetical protein n=1 Tax=Myroides odoratus TaxID=256 RepID=UPI0039B0C733
MKQEEEINLCIQLINWMQDSTLPNEEIISRIHTQGFLAKALILDQQRKGKIVGKSLQQLVEHVLQVLERADPTLEVHNQRYPYSFLDVVYRLLQCCENEAVSTTALQAYVEAAEDEILQSRLANFTIEKLLLDGEVRTSLAIISKIKDKAYHYSSYRLIAHYYAERGDKVNFLQVLKKCDARKDIYDLEEIKEIFIQTYAIEHPLEKVVALVQNKPFGNQYYVAAFLPLVKIKSFSDIQTLLTAPQFQVSKLYLQEIILTNAFRYNEANQTLENFSILQQMLDKIPARVRWAPSDFSLKDNLWSFTADALLANQQVDFTAEVIYCSKKISAKIIKDNLKKQLKTYRK